MKRFLDRFTTFEFVIIAMSAALGIAIKPLIVPLVHIVTGPLMIPGGAVAGGFYMMWIVLGADLVQRRGTGTLIGFVQAVIVMASGVFGTHGILSIVTYTLPGIATDIAFWALKRDVSGNIRMFTGGAAANICGTLLSNLIFFRLPLVPLMLGLSAAALSGGLGGLLAWKIGVVIKKNMRI